MTDRSEEGSDRPQGGFLPPEPAGPEPELGQRPSPAPPEPQPQAPTWQPPLTGGPPPQQGGWQTPAGPGAGPAAGGAGQPPNWQPPPPDWAQPPPGQGWQQTQQPWGYAHEPDNGPAVTGFVLAMVSIGLWLFSAGLSSLVSLGLAIGGLLASRRGKHKVASGETRKHKGLAQAGFVCNIVMIVLAALSTIFWGIFWIAFATDEDFRNELEDDDSDGNPFRGDGISTSLRAGALVVRLTSSLLS